MRNQSNSGNVVLLICILLVLVLVFIVVVADQAVKDSARQGATDTLLQDVYEGVVGNTAKGTFGYLGDVGNYPPSLMDLTTNSGLAGWNGPYVNAPIVNNMLVDHYSAPLEYFLSVATGTNDRLAVISRGRDHGSTNSASNPNVSSQFAGTLPSAGTSYTTANSDNDVYPSISDTNSLLRENAGTLSYNITNFDVNTTFNSVVAGCASLYSLNITSVPRGASDTTTLTYPSTLYSQSLSAQLLQGLYDIEVTSPQALTPLLRERVSILPGVALQRDLLAPRIDSGGAALATIIMPPVTMTVYNNTSPGASISITNFSNGATNGLANTTSGNIRTYTNVKPCTRFTADIGGTTVDSWIMPYSNYVRVIKQLPQTTYSLTVTNAGANSDVIKVVHTGFRGTTNFALVLGTVYKKKTRTFIVPGTQAAGALPAGNQGIVIEFRKRDNTLIGSANIYTASQPNIIVP
jgi:hypothetical protein